jgi:ATP-dependent helicase/nuclease subunit B
MLHPPLLIPPSAAFWAELADALLEHGQLGATAGTHAADLSAIRVVVPTFEHARLLKAALAKRLDCPFIPPAISTLPAWLALFPPQAGKAMPVGQSRRLMALYSELRQHGWLKKLFSARRNTDLLPLAQTLLTLSDEITAALLPALDEAAADAGQRWQQALERFPAPVRHMLSDETQLVWSVWKSQLDGSDPLVAFYRQMMQLADAAPEPLVWVTPTEIDPFAQSFLARYGERQPVLPVLLDWRAGAVGAAYGAAWEELLEEGPECDAVAVRSEVALHAAPSLESEALHGAQTVVDWLASGKTSIAIIAQDRVAARRIRALLERSQVYVSDETGWKLSTTRAAGALAAWLDVVALRGDTVALLDLLKSPFLFAQRADKADRIMAIELALRRANVRGGWDTVLRALAQLPAERALVNAIAAQANACSGRRTLAQWVAQTHAAFDALDMRAALEADAAGNQVASVIDTVELECDEVAQPFSFQEWRSFISSQLESVSFMPPQTDTRVMMMPLNGARLRSFDAVLLVGADADHLPSQPVETLFFANAVRRELGLPTRESLQRQQLRDLAGVLHASSQVVLSWQSHKDGEPNAVSPWIARLNLALEQRGERPLALHQVELVRHDLVATPSLQPAPAAALLAPKKLSASGYNTLVACPYQFFATRMLGLAALDELSDLPEKRDYGEWLHHILNTYHQSLLEHDVADRAQLLADISADVFGKILDHSPAALGYYARWRKAMPAYLAWAAEREAKGWRFAAGEQEFSCVLATDAGDIVLHGRIDRVDSNDAGEYAVLDYKTRDAASLRKKLRGGEDHQLAFYGLAYGREHGVTVAAAHLVALEARDGKTGDAAAVDYEQWKQQLEQQIKASVDAIAGGAGLPAHGIEAVCRFCDVRGLCRKGHW